MKTLHIESPVGRRLAEIALFERLQSYFNLHPGAMAQAVKESAERLGLNPAELFSEKRKQLMEVLPLVLNEAVAIVKNEMSDQKLDMSDDFWGLVEYFNLTPGTVARDIVKRAKAEGLDPVECITYIESVMPEIFRQVLDQTERIIWAR